MLAANRRLVAWLVLVTAVLVPILSWDWFLGGMRTTYPKASLGEIFQLDHPVLRERVLEALHLWASPVGVWFALGWKRIFLLLGSGLAVAWLWNAMTAREERGAGRFLMAALAAVPTLVGLAMVPLMAYDGWSALARAGLNAPELLGLTYGGALLAPIVGGLATLLTLAAFPLVARRRTASDDGKSG